MGLDTICQLGAMIGTGSMSLLLGSGDGAVRRWGFIIGLCGQPFWFYTTINHHQWPFVVLTVLLTYMNIRGIYTHRVFSKWRIKDKKGLEL